ncbi:uncharacterized protein LOC128985359 [Macrosteles quadrilineatus]|uniref:uncharacterized protein LOC128985359 n=1 Tax=Macrosteles quadrilineatus TaxID=74068 RepID=UPI0023E138C8|nr:uncharacterized protein LOC128985359 [Macrosteles quadrilineatus]
MYFSFMLLVLANVIDLGICWFGISSWSDFYYIQEKNPFSHESTGNADEPCIYTEYVSTIRYVDAVLYTYTCNPGLKCKKCSVDKYYDEKYETRFCFRKGSGCQGIEFDNYRYRNKNTQRSGKKAISEEGKESKGENEAVLKGVGTELGTEKGTGEGNTADEGNGSGVTESGTVQMTQQDTAGRNTAEEGIREGNGAEEEKKSVEDSGVTSVGTGQMTEKGTGEMNKAEEGTPIGLAESGTEQRTKKDTAAENTDEKGTRDLNWSGRR